ncbi:hypothetical protein EON79_15040 [bacterium]|nr:MAG: hypothetical protein EON79_15040 [bacterium]
MAMTATYTTVNGQILHEERNGVETEFVPDPIGSVIQTRNSAGNTTSTAVYWPYGEVRTSTGTNPSPWGYIGTLGYYGGNIETLYIRARYYVRSYTRWLTVDPLWPKQLPYAYVDSQPTLNRDPLGLVAGLGAAGLGCAIAGGFGFISGLTGGGSVGSAACKGAISCVVAGLFSFIAGNMPWLAKCIASTVVGALAGMASSICSPAPADPCIPKIPWQCVAIGALIGLVGGCITGGLGSDVQQQLLRFVLPAIGLGAGSICADQMKGRPGRFPPGTIGVPS